MEHIALNGHDHVLSRFSLQTMNALKSSQEAWFTELSTLAPHQVKSKHSK